MSVMVVTGGGRGIGAEIARQGAAAGYAVAVNYARDAEAAGGVVADIAADGGRAAAYQGDVADPDAVGALFDAAARDLGPITAVVNNAGITGRIGRLEDAEPETIRQVIDLNVTGLIYCCRAAVRRMSTRFGGTGGAIVNISSGAATMGSANSYVWYAASKAAVDTLTLGLSQEVGGDGVRVNSVQPGVIDTEIHAAGGIPDRAIRLGAGTPLGRHGTVAEVADAVMYLLSGRASYITGAVLRVAGGR